MLGKDREVDPGTVPVGAEWIRSTWLHSHGVTRSSRTRLVKSHLSKVAAPWLQRQCHHARA
jgi:hypothetical protein